MALGGCRGALCSGGTAHPLALASWRRPNSLLGRPSPTLPLPPHTPKNRLENTLNYGMERVWALGTVKGSNNLALGFDEVRWR